MSSSKCTSNVCVGLMVNYFCTCVGYGKGIMILKLFTGYCKHTLLQMQTQVCVHLSQWRRVNSGVYFRYLVSRYQLTSRVSLHHTHTHHRLSLASCHCPPIILSSHLPESTQKGVQNPFVCSELLFTSLLILLF